MTQRGGAVGGLAQPWVVAPPALPGFAVERPRLLRRLDRACSKRLTTVTAPAGSGKSVLLAQWARARPHRRIAWVALDEHVGAPELAHRLVAGVEAIEPGFGAASLTQRDLRGTQLGPAFLQSFLTELASLEDVVLVIDDLDRVPNLTSIDEIGSLIERAPSQVHVVVVARADLPFGAGRIHVEDQVVEIRQDLLAFDRDEAEALVRGVSGMTLGEHHLDVLESRTEGWAAGLQEAALALRDRDDPERFLEAFGGDDRYVADYLTAEVLDRQSTEVRDFLLSTSVLDELNASLCNFVTGTGDSQAMLEHLDQRSLFVLGLDRRRECYRYHTLFRDLLRYRFRAEQGEGAEHATLRRAAEWYVRHDDPDRAARFLARAEAWDELVALVLDHAVDGYERGLAAAVVGWMELLPSERLAEARVELTYGVLNATAGRDAVAERHLVHVDQRRDATPGERVVAGMWLASLIQWRASPSGTVELAERVLADLDVSDPADLPDVLGLSSPSRIRFAAHALLGRARLYQWQLDAARDAMDRALLDDESPYPVWHVFTLGSRAMVEAWAGRLGAARELATHALTVSGGLPGPEHHGTADAHLTLGQVARERDDLDVASLHLDAAGVQALRNGRHLLLWLHLIEQAALLLARGELVEALALLENGPPSGAPPAQGVIRERLLAMQVSAHLELGDLARAHHLTLGPEPVSPELAGVTVRLALAGDDLPLARKVIDHWPETTTLRGWCLHGLWSAVIDDWDGDTSSALARLGQIVERVEPEGHLRLFLDAGIDVTRLVRELYHRQPSSYLRQLVERPSNPSRGGVRGDLIESLTDREMAVLAYLPTRLSNGEVAEQLYVSVNTVKTHLKHIYGKLGVDSRRAAVERAEAIGLL